MPASSTVSSRRSMRSAGLCRSPAGSRQYVESATGSSAKAELAAALHRLRSTLARLKAELELSQVDGTVPPVDRLLSDLEEAFAHLGLVEDAIQAPFRVLVVDDDGRLAEITARGLRRLGYEACLLYTSPSPRDRQKSRMPSSA